DHHAPVALKGDGTLYTPRAQVARVGRTTPFPSGPGVLAQRTGALLMCGYCVRTSPGRFRLVIEPPIDPAAYATTAELHQAVAATAERHIREHLGQWCIFRPLWDEPAPAPAVQPVGVERGADA
ncbi:MAG: hypothetical protein ACKOC6_01280, partial [bacterium]